MPKLINNQGGFISLLVVLLLVIVAVIVLVFERVAHAHK